jgi:hypothetical protein
MTVKDQIMTLLNDGLPRNSVTVARELNRPQPSVRRTLVDLFCEHKVERDEVTTPYRYRRIK